MAVYLYYCTIGSGIVTTLLLVAACVYAAHQERVRSLKHH
jgi:hypothetical protein